MTLSTPFPTTLPGPGASPAALPPSRAPASSADAVAPPDFADCLTTASADVAASDAAPTANASAAPIPPHLCVNKTPLTGEDGTPAPAAETAPELPDTTPPSRPAPLPRRNFPDPPDTPWPPDGLSSLPLVPAASAAMPAAVQDASIPLAGAEPGEGRFPSAVAVDTLPLSVAESTAAQADNPQWFSAMRAHGIHPPAPSADPVPATTPADAPQPEATASTLPATAAITETPAPAAAVPSAESAIMTAPVPAYAAPAQSAAAAAPPDPPSTSLPTPNVHADDFPGSIASHVYWLAERGIGHARIHINPRELGPVDVYLTLTGDQLRADFSSAQPEVRQALEHSLPQLRHLLDQHGLQLAHADISQHQRGQHAPDAGSTNETVIEIDPSQSISDLPPHRSLPTRHLLDAYA